MKIKAISNILKASKKVITYTDEDKEGSARWLGNGVAMYLMDERIAFVNAEQWTVFLDVPEAKRESWDYDDRPLPLSDVFQDECATEEEIQASPFTVGWRDMVFRFFICDGKVLTVNEEYLKPFWGMEDYIRFTARRFEGGDICVAVKNGFFIQAVIFPYRLEKTKTDGDMDNGQADVIDGLNEVGTGLSRQMEAWQRDHEQNEGGAK